IPLLYADSRVARGLAAQSLLAAPQDQALPADVRARFEAVIAEYQLSEEFNSDRPESLNNLAGMYSAMGEAALAERYFRQAMAQAPWFAPAYVNLAEHYRRADDEAAGIAVLEQAL